MKGIGCITIVLHHLAFYGPISEVINQSAPWLIDGLVKYARQAVQMFFVLAGFLIASQIAKFGSTQSQPPATLIWKRYKRLVTPFLFAIACATLITAIVRPWFQDPSLSDPPSITQLIAHAFLVSDLFHQQALSAGVWFVAIDFQLFAATVLLTVIMHHASTKWRIAFPVLIVLLSALSLWVVSRNTQYEDYAPYFFGAYGLGMIAWWSSRPGSGPLALLIIASLGSIALILEYRNAIAVALATAVLVSIASQKDWLKQWPKPGLFTWFGRRSYSIFLIHYGICIGVNAVWGHLFPKGLVINVVGMLVAVAGSIGAGALLYRYVESQHGVIGRNKKTSLLIIAVLATLVIEKLNN